MKLPPWGQKTLPYSRLRGLPEAARPRGGQEGESRRPMTNPDYDTLAEQEAESFCRAMNQRSAPVTVYNPGRIAALVIARTGGELICTQGAGHDGSHAACDGQGHILARWPRKAAGHYWQRSDCEGHGHA